jgi:protein-tyrosine phosphatase
MLNFNQPSGGSLSYWFVSREKIMERAPRMAAVALAIATILCTLSAQADERIVGLKGQPNFRDIAGYETGDGRKIKPGLVYRSGELPKLTDEDVETLHALGIKTVVNFLTPGEIEWRGRDRLPDGVREINIPITGEVAGIPDAANQLVEARKSGDFRKFPPEFNRQVHEELVSGIADQQYSELFKILADKSNYPLVYHCSHGIHRTGSATALVLSALGVQWETVREDYLLSNVARQSEISRRVDQLEDQANKIPMSDKDRSANSEAIRAFYVLQPEYIDASRKAAAQKYGSLDRYLEDGLGLKDQQIRDLRELLTSSPGNQKN